MATSAPADPTAAASQAPVTQNTNPGCYTFTRRKTHKFKTRCKLNKFKSNKTACKVCNWARMQIFKSFTWLVSTGIGVKAACDREMVGPNRSFVPLRSCLYSRLCSTFSFSFGRTASKQGAYPGGGRNLNSPWRPPSRKRTLLRTEAIYAITTQKVQI